MTPTTHHAAGGTTSSVEILAIARRAVSANKLLSYATATHREPRLLAPEMLGFTGDGVHWEATSKGIAHRTFSDHADAAPARITWAQVAELLQAGLQPKLIDALREAYRRYCDVASNRVDSRKDPEAGEAHRVAYRAASGALNAAQQAIWDAAIPTEAQDTLW